MARVRLQQLEKRYGDVLAVRGVDLEVADGEFVVLVGPSGCGKSTTLRMVAGLEEITSGTLTIGDRVVNTVAPKDRDIAMVFQSYALYPHMSVRENMAFGLRMRGTPPDEIAARVAETSRILELDAYLDRKPKALSGGQRQRVAMGRAIVRRPAVFLFDEPLSNLDAKLRVQMRAEIARLHRRLSATILYVTHDQVEAMTLASRIVVMKDGEVQQIGAPLEVYERPANRFVAGFIGSPSMNFVPAQADAGRLLVGDLAFALPAPFAHARGAVTLGIRPEDVRTRANAGGMRIPARVELVEPLGAEAFVTTAIPGGASLVARVPSRELPREGETVQLSLDVERLHLFELGDNGRSLALVEQSAPKPAKNRCVND